jgi:signal transduction histidine kinase
LRIALIPLALVLTAALSVAPLDLSSLGSGEPIGRSFTYGVDKGGTWTWDQAWTASARFTPCKEPFLDFGFSPDVYWLRLDWIKSDGSPKELWLAQWATRVGKVDVRFRDRATWTEGPFFSGIDQKDDHRLPKHFPSVYPLPAVSQGSLLVRIESTTSLSFIPAICDSPTLAFEDAMSYAGLGLMSGFFLLMLLFNLFMLTTIRDRFYLWYTFYLLSFWAYLLLYTGVLKSLAPGLEPYLTPTFFLSELLLFVTSWIFASKVNRFEVWKGTVWARRSLFSIVVVLLGVYFLGNRRTANELILLTSAIVMLGIEAGTILQMIRGNHLSRFFAAGWSCMLVSIGWMTFGSIGSLGPTTNMFGDTILLIFGVMVEMTCFAGALAVRVRSMQKEFDRFQERNSQAARLGTLGLLTAQVGHEINTPNHIIALNASLLSSLHRTIKEDRIRAREDGLAETLNEDSKLGETEPLVKAILTASGQINQVLTRLRAEVRPQDQPVPLDLGLVARQTAKLYELRWREETYRLSVRTPDTPVIVLGVEFRLQQLVVNLVTNALHSLADRDKAVTLTIEALGREAILTVADEGRGMSQEVQAMLGTPFFTTRRSQDGTGLGWGLCQEIVREHRGRVELESQVGIGTTVRVRFPCASTAGSRSVD